MTVTITTLHGQRADLPDGRLAILREQLRGRVAWSPGTSGVARTRDVFNAMHVGRPRSDRAVLGHSIGRQQPQHA